MRILFISNDLIAGNLALILKREGHAVKLFIEDVARRNNYDGMIEKVNDWEAELSWVGKNGLIIFDDVGYGKDQDSLRKKGYSVVGGSLGGDKLEQDRDFGQKIFEAVGMRTVPLYDFKNSSAALRFARKNKKAWVIKQNNHHYSKSLNYIGSFDDGRDVIDMLARYANHKEFYNEKVSLQEKIVGVEIGIGRYFNGKNWVGPIEFNLEHPRFFPGDIGPLTSEMGTLAWYDTNEQNRLYQETLALIEDHLRKIDFRGDFEINCIVNETGAHPLEATSRFGSPIIHLHSEIHRSPWGEFLLALARGENYDLKWNPGYGIVTLVAAPPFPYSTDDFRKSVLIGSPIYLGEYAEENIEHLHFEETAYSPKTKSYHISDCRGYVLYVTAMGKTVAEAQKKSADIIRDVQFPKMMYRNDIGKKFLEADRAKLVSWGYLEKNSGNKRGKGVLERLFS